MIYARVVAKPVDFPKELEIHYQTLDRDTGERVAVFGAERHFSWDEVRRRFSVGEALVLEIEDQLRRDETALIAPPQEWESERNPTETSFVGTITSSLTHFYRTH
jgi:hypothetical protein